MGEAADHGPGGLLGMQQALLPADFQQPVHRLQFHQQPAVPLASHRGDDQVDMDLLARVQSQQHAATCQRVFACQHLPQACQPLAGVQHELTGMHPQGACGGRFQQRLARRIQAGNPQFRVQSQHACADVIQYVLLHHCPIFERLCAVSTYKKQK